MMTIHFDITLNDLLAFNHYFANQSSLLRRYYWSILIGVPLIVTFLAFIFNSRITISVLIFPLIFLGIWAIIFPRTYKRSITHNITKTIESGQNKGTIGAHVITITDQYLHEATEVNESRWIWPGIERIEQDADYIFIFTSPILAHIIPKRAFASPEAATAFYTAALGFYKQAKGQVTSNVS